MMHNFNTKTQTIKERTIFKPNPSCFTLLYINCGTGKYIYHHEIDVFLPHSIFLISQENGISITPSSKFVCTITKVDFSKDFLDNQKLFSQATKFLLPLKKQKRQYMHLALSSTNAQGIYSFLDILNNEYTDIKPLSFFIIQNTLASLIIYIARIIDFTLIDNQDRKPNTKTNLIEQVKTTIENNYNQQISLNSIANQYYINPSYLSHTFKKKVGISLTNYLINTRIQQSKLLLLDTEELVIDIAIACGFNTIAHFNSCFKKLEHCTPTQFRHKHKIRNKASL